MIKSLKITVSCVGIMALTGCANLASIDRTTRTPEKGKAVHLDAQQRLVTFDQFGNSCAENSPDALAAFASALAGSASDPSDAAAVLSGSGSSSVASFGLRTQSITLMRDLMFRMCEASKNGQIGSIDVANYLTRSQDFTATILAIEQLTGPVTAAQAATMGGSGSTAMASLSQASEMYDLQREALEKQKIAFEQTTADLARKTADVEKLDVQLGTLKAERDALDPAKPNEKIRIAELNILIGQKENGLTASTVEKGILESRQKRQQATVSQMEADLTKLGAMKDAAFASATSETQTGALIGTNIIQNRISEKTIAEIADTVEKLVTAVLEKDYKPDICLSALRSPPNGGLLVTNETEAEKASRLKLDREFRALCLDLIAADIQRERSEIGQPNSSQPLTYGNPVATIPPSSETFEDVLPRSTVVQ